MPQYTWFNGYPPPDLEITQVYGLFFTDCERLLLFIAQKGNYSLPGGSPEAYDAGIADTLRRETLEEVNTEIQDPIIVGYQVYDNEKSAQVRMMAMIKEIKPAQPDPASGLVYQRLLATPAKAIELLNWHDTGEAQINAAVKIARDQFNTSIKKCTKCFGEPSEENEKIYI
jgi:ADP-ribose pyrophosphatase YjhB (NUDIX family)